MIVSDKETFFDVIAKFYALKIIDAFHRFGILGDFVRGKSALDLSEKYNLEAGMLEYLCEFVNQIDEGRLKSSLRMMEGNVDRSLIGVEFALDQYVGAYGHCFEQLECLLTRATDKAPDRGSGQSRHADSYEESEDWDHNPLSFLLARLKPKFVVDLGCNTGRLLRQLASRDPEFRGIGVDLNAIAISRARALADNEGLSARLQFATADASDLPSLMEHDTRALVEVVVASSILNEFDFAENKPVISFLQSLKRSFPGSILLACDYYGLLGMGYGETVSDISTLVHDVAQVVSGQGVPPSSFDSWREIYEAADLAVLRVIDLPPEGSRTFVHILQM